MPTTASWEERLLTLPKYVDRPAQPYAAIRALVTMKTLDEIAPGRIEALFRRLGERGITPAGPLFFRYLAIDMDADLEIDFGVAVAAPIAPDEVLVAGTIPGGRYASVTYFGPYDDLYDVNTVMIGFARQRGLLFDQHVEGTSDVFGGRFEIYHTDPMAEPDPSKWETELAIRLADQG